MSFFAELKRRNVVRVGIAYAVIGWALAQVAEFAVDNFSAPDWTLKIFVIFLILGLPLALFFAWAFEITPEGVKREKDVDRSQSITGQTGRKLDFIIIGVLVVAVGFLLVDKFYEVDVPIERQSIAVLPFENFSADSDHFADGLTEELLNLLAKNRDLKVIGRTSSFAFKDKNEDLRVIGNALGVGHVLEGSVRRSGDTLRITAQLNKVADGSHLWSETYDRTMADIFDIQDEVAAAITRALQLHLTPVSDRPTDNEEAYALYLEALPLVSGEVQKKYEQIVQYLDQAIALDPLFARAWELKAATYSKVATFRLDGPVAQRLSNEAAARAIAIDPSLPVARALSSMTDPETWSWIQEIEALETLIEAEPDNVFGLDLLAWDLILTGYFNEALSYHSRVVELEPLSASSYGGKADALSAAGRRDEAEQLDIRALELGFDPAMFVLGVAFLHIGDDEAAIAWLEKWNDAFGIKPSDVRTFVESARSPETGRDFLKSWVEDSVASAQGMARKRHPYTWYLAFDYLDDYWQAIELLDGGGAGLTNGHQLRYMGMKFGDSGYIQHPRYLQDAEKVGTIALWEKRGPPDRCNKESGEWVCD